MADHDETAYGFATRAIHIGQEADPATGATVPPIHPTSTYTQASPGRHKGYKYSRTGNPTRDGLERCLASLEGGRVCACFSSGSAASAAVLGTLAPGDRVLVYADVYGGTFRLMTGVFEAYGVEPLFVVDVELNAFEERVTEEVAMVWIETPTNPLLRCLDIAGIARVAHGVGAKLVVDNTFATPALQLPLKLGADYVVHSTTKYIGGHSDVTGGAVIVQDAALLERVAFLQNAFGAVPGAFDCYLQHRGVKTLALRMQRHCENAARLAAHIRGHEKLEQVIYPFLDDHPDCELARQQMRGGGGMLSIRFREDDRAVRFCECLRLFALAESLGGVESLCCLPAVMSHASVPKNLREARGVTDGLVRLSVGVETAEDLVGDIDQALAVA